jgi:hypothetical protein
MKSLDLNEVVEYVEIHISEFHDKRLLKIKRLALDEILCRKNPYLFKAKNILTAQGLVENILDAYLSSQEETLFGEFMEGLAIFVADKTVGAHKSAFIGIDMQFEREDTIYLVEIKSGPNWANSSQINKLRQNFATAKNLLAQQTDKKVIAINGCCYGRENSSDKGGYLKLCGQEFWHFISGDEQLYTQLIEPIGYRAKEKNQAFLEAYGALINQFTAEFYKNFCSTDGYIIWEKLVAYNSAKLR